MTAVPAEDDEHHFVLTSFHDVMAPAEVYQAGEAITVVCPNDRDERRRVVDFLAGLTFGVGGTMRKHGPSTYRLLHT
ncbi:MAG: cell division protein SepF [Actinomycetota bacterium]|nr:cell division protein SepF [Actinomycetota bacterium]